jgi:hypothetical protein
MRYRVNAASKAVRHRTWLAGAIALVLAGPAFGQSKPTVEELQRRLEALEQRYGAAPQTSDGQALPLRQLRHGRPREAAAAGEG